MNSQLILIAGISRSGKSTLASSLAKKLDNAIHLEQDQFVLSEDNIPKILDRIDWETPKSIDWAKWNQQIEDALNTHQFIIAEGIFAFNDFHLLQKASATISLSLSKREFLERRRKELRWGIEPEWFLEHVWEAHLMHHNPHKITPTLPFNNYTEDALELIIQHIRSF